MFYSTQQRSFRTAEIAFAGRDVAIIKDARINECDYGEWNGRAEDEVRVRKKPFRHSLSPRERVPEGRVRVKRADHITVPFPDGESYAQTTERMRNFLQDLLANDDGKRVLMIGHRATQYGLEHLINHVPLAQAVTAPWRWQPGWEYQLTQMAQGEKYSPRRFRSTKFP